MCKPKGVMFLTLVFMLMALSCSSPESDQPLLTAELPLHLEEHINDARIEGSEVPEVLPDPVEWRFDEPQPEWKPVKPLKKQWKAVKPVRVKDALRLPLSEEHRADRPRLWGEIYVTLPDWNIENWAYIEITARTSDPVRRIGLDFNYTEEDHPKNFNMPFYTEGDSTPLFTDGTVQTYRLSLDCSKIRRRWNGPWTDLGIWFNSQDNEEAVTLDILSVRVIPKEHIYADTPIGVKTVIRGKTLRRTLYTHTPGCIEYCVRIPQAGRLDFGVGVLNEDSPVTYRIVASQTDEEETLFEETYANLMEWGQRSLDLSSMAGKTARIALEADAERSGAVALWAAPTLTGTRSTKKPNVIFYVIDGAYAKFMSVYGYNRRTTPNLEKLASEGVVFDLAYSNSTWTGPSTTTFMTSLHNSVLGGIGIDDTCYVPDNVVTMAQHFHRAGYNTAVVTTNPYCGTMNGLDKGVDFLREAGAENTLTSSRELHEDFWSWRESFPGEPYWAHFQTTDVHGGRFEGETASGGSFFDGIYLDSNRRKTYHSWKQQLWDADVPYIKWNPWNFPPLPAFEKTGIDRLAYFRAYRDLLDEAMAHNDHQIGRMVERLKAKGEWEHTLFILASDHGHGLAYALQEKLPDHWDPYFRPMFTRIPLIIVWPGKINPGLRFDQAVSMIDVLPTVLELVGLPQPDVIQGQSLVPLLMGKEGWESRPVILDEFDNHPKANRLCGNIEVIDGRWGASLQFESRPEEDRNPYKQRPAPLLIYDLWNDPYCLQSLHEKRPDLVKKYTKFLEAQWKAHQSLAQHFTRSGDSPLTPEQLETLRSLGYIR